ncbi:MAG: excisionase family DNA-binding protein [Candidatus Dormibacteria bacterium]
MLGVSRQFVDRLIARGALHCERLPGSTHRRISAAEVERFAEVREESQARHRKAVAAMDAADVPWEPENPVVS